MPISSSPTVTQAALPWPFLLSEGWPDLFGAVQSRRIFSDSKIFVDCIPKRDPQQIIADYQRTMRAGPGNDVLKRFVEENFILPEATSADMVHHISALWGLLTRMADKQVVGSSLIPLPRPYVVPGDRFREIYYWDSYFTMLGLRESGWNEMVEHMVENFAYLIRHLGFIPNGNRTYYLSRSQPPYFSLMVDLLADHHGPLVYSRYLSELETEYAYWMDRTAETRHSVPLPDGGLLGRYYDRLDTPRPEAHAEDELVAQRSLQDRSTLMRNIRSAAESGWDFSSRWLTDGQHLETIQTTDLLPVDLNCLLWHLEKTIASGQEAAGNTKGREHYNQLADRRARAIAAHCWCDEQEFFCDYNLRTHRPNRHLSLAGVTPLFFRLATPEQAKKVARIVEERFLKAGGVVTTLIESTHQWDSPNGWAPLQWLTVQGLENYGHRTLAAEIARRWIKLNQDVFGRTGRFMEKYNVIDTTLRAGGGEYPLQDGFGWTNAILIKLIRIYG